MDSIDPSASSVNRGRCCASVSSVWKRFQKASEKTGLASAGAIDCTADGAIIRDRQIREQWSDRCEPGLVMKHVYDTQCRSQRQAVWRRDRCEFPKVEYGSFSDRRVDIWRARAKAHDHTGSHTRLAFPSCPLLGQTAGAARGGSAYHPGRSRTPHSPFRSGRAPGAFLRFAQGTPQEHFAASGTSAWHGLRPLRVASRDGVTILG